MNRYSPLRFVAVAGLVTGALASSAQAETTACTAITNALVNAAVPYKITVPGIYCLTEDIATVLAAGKAIDIQTHSVVLDLNGHRMGNIGAGPGTAAIGIYAVGRQNITIMNGTIRGFEYGIRLDDTAPSTSQGHVIEGLRVDYCRRYGILAKGRGIVVRNNQVIATGGTTLSPNSDAIGVHLTGPGPRVLDNDIITVTPTGIGTARGLVFMHAEDALAVNNRITSANRGIDFFFSPGKYRDNVTSSVNSPYNGGTDAGNNN
jgi:hypothetical protein